MDFEYSADLLEGPLLRGQGGSRPAPERRRGLPAEGNDDVEGDGSGSDGPSEPPEDRSPPAPPAAADLDSASPDADDMDVGGAGGYGNAAGPQTHGWPGGSGGSGGGEVAAAGPGPAVGSGGPAPGEYNPAEFRHLNVTEDIRDVFKHIGRYRPAQAQLPAPLKPFVPDYIPALGDIDEFLKVPRPDGKPDFLGLKVLDEPAAVQSDPSVLALRLRQLARGGAAAAAALDAVGCVDHAADRTARARAINTWAASVAEVHRKRPAASVAYTSELPDINALMQEFPPEVEAALRVALPTADLDLDLEGYARLVCAIMDVPVRGGGGAEPATAGSDGSGSGGRPLLEALHLLFVLLLEFRSNPFFRQALSEDGGTGGGAGGQPPGTAAGSVWPPPPRSAGGVGSSALPSPAPSSVRTR